MLGYPPPPAYYKEFERGATALQPPDIGSLGPTYRMFGRVVQNPKHAENAQFHPPPIDRDVIMYDPKGPLKQQINDLIKTLPNSVLELLDAVQNKPTDTNKELRDLDSRIKSLFHALECLRPHEAKLAILEQTRREVRIREEANSRCKEAIQEARKLFT